MIDIYNTPMYTYYNYSQYTMQCCILVLLNPVQFMLSLIHWVKVVTLVKSPGAPMPHLEVPPDTTPTSCQGESLLLRAIRGPPLSPLQLSFPSSPPAQRWSEGLKNSILLNLSCQELSRLDFVNWDRLCFIFT